MIKTLKGSLEYEVTITDTGIDIKFPDELEARIASMVSAYKLVKLTQTNLKSNMGFSKGLALKKIKDRHSKSIHAEFYLSSLAQDLVKIYLQENEKTASDPISPDNGNQEPGSVETTTEKDQVEARA